MFGGAGMWAGGWLDDDRDDDGGGGHGERVGGGVAGVYVPGAYGSNRVFMHVSDDSVVVVGSGGDHNNSGDDRVDDQ